MKSVLGIGFLSEKRKGEWGRLREKRRKGRIEEGERGYKRREREKRKEDGKKRGNRRGTWGNFIMC